MQTILALCCLLPALGSALSMIGPNLKVIGGSNANIANNPWQASLRNNANHACGAVLISATRALTAAHCGGSAINVYSLLSGTTDRTVTVCQTCSLRSPIVDFIRHPGFVNNPSAGYPNDIAAVWFYSIATNVNIQYIELAQPTDGDFTGASCVVSGWGRQAASGTLPTTLQAGSMSVISNDQCIEVWGATRIQGAHICASDPNVSACGGDNGGPLVCGGKLAGVFSWGEATCSPQYPSVFIRVSSYYDWIIENVLPNTEDEPIDESRAVEELMASMFE